MFPNEIEAYRLRTLSSEIYLAQSLSILESFLFFNVQ